MFKNIPPLMNKSPSTAGLTRRDLLVRAAVGGGLMVGFALPGPGRPGQAQAATTSSNLTAWIAIGADETVTLLVPITEMGQGTMTGLASLVADQLLVDWSKIKVEHAPVDAAHGGANANMYGFRFTGGSTGMRLTAQLMQQTAANARQMLINAAASKWGVSSSACSTQSVQDPVLGTVTQVVCATTSPPKSATYGALAATAVGLPVVTNAVLLQGGKYAGAATSPPRVDIPDKITGAAKFGIDIWEAGMLFAAVKHCPTTGGTVSSVGSKPAGGVAVVKVGGNGTTTATGVVAVAATTWDAMKAVKALSVNWTLPIDAASRDTAAITLRANALMANGSALTAQSTGSWANGMDATGAKTISSMYQVPYLAHAALEPLNCTVRYTPATGTTPARCEVGAPTQAPDSVLATATSMCPAGTLVTVVNTLLGGGFGRKFEQDFIVEAMQVGLARPGKLVKLTWPREEDFSNDQFRPTALTRITAAATPDGTITAWNNRIVTPSIANQRSASPTMPPTTVDDEAVHGAISRSGYADAGLPYDVPNSLVEWVWHDAPIRLGYWRSVGMSFNTFAVECAIDELAAAIGMDPLSFRQKNLAETRLGAVLDALRTLSKWDTAPVAGRARGVAIAAGFGSYIGQVAEIAVNATTGAVTVHSISTVLDCGTAIHRDAIKGQIEGAVAQALSPILWAQQTFVKGVAQATNYNRYRPAKLQDMPQFALQVIEGGGLGGVGEVGMPCVAPAIANAYARLAAQGQLVAGLPITRKRSLPFFPGTTLGGL